MKKARILALLLALSLIVTSFAACGGSTASSAAPAESAAGSDAASEADAAVDTSNAEFEMKLSNVVPETDIVNSHGYFPMAEYIEKESGGRIKCTIYPNRQLSNSNVEDIEKVNSNIVQFSSAPASGITSATGIKDFQIFDVPYLFTSSDDIFGYYDDVFNDIVVEKVTGASNMLPYPAFHVGWCKISANSGPLDSPDALKGLKVRVMNSDMYIEYINSLGGTGVPMAYGETFTALQQGTVDGLMTGTSVWVDDKFMEVQSYLCDADPFVVLHVPMVNKDWFNSLPEDLQQIVDDGIRNVFLPSVREEEDNYEQECLQVMADAGIEITYLTDEQKQAFIDATAHMTQMASDALGADLVAGAQEYVANFNGGGSADAGADDSAASEAASEVEESSSAA